MSGLHTDKGDGLHFLKQVIRLLSMKKGNMTLPEAAMKCPTCVVSVMGDHAGEDADAIFDRKKADIDRTGVTFWLMRSPKQQGQGSHLDL